MLSRYLYGPMEWTSKIVISKKDCASVIPCYKKLLYLGMLDTISQKYESLDYDTNFNSLLLDEVRSRGYKFVVRKDVLRWVVMFFVGILTALVACCIDISVEEGSKIKYGFLSWLTEKER